MKDYSNESCRMEPGTGGTVLHISNHISKKPRNDFWIWISTESESTFIEILNAKKTKTIVGCIYRDRNIELNEFNDYYFNNLLDKLSKENNTVFLLDDFNIELLSYDQNSLTN